MKKKIIITGGLGYIGTDYVSYILAKAYQKYLLSITGLSQRELIN